MEHCAAVKTYSFHGVELRLIDKDGDPYIAMKQVVEVIGLSWSSERKKIKSQPKKFGGVVINSIAGNGQPRKMLYIPLRKLDMWVCTINPNNIPGLHIRACVELYQKECAVALDNYWDKRIAVQPGTVGEASTDPFIASMQARIKGREDQLKLEAAQHEDARQTDSSFQKPECQMDRDENMFTVKEWAKLNGYGELDSRVAQLIDDELFIIAKKQGVPVGQIPSWMER